MKYSAILVNVSRGPVVDEAALFRVLESNAIAGAALDVWYRYPDGDAPVMPSSAPFWKLQNVIMTQHNSGMTDDTFRNRAQTIGNNLRGFGEGEPLLLELNSDQA